MDNIAVIGGGISGVAAAHYARQLGYRVDVYEQAPDLGGRVGCTTLGTKPVEFGGKNIGLRYQRFRRFTDALGGIEYETFGLNSSRVIRGKVARFNKDGSPLRTLAQVWRMCGARGMLQLLPHAIAIRRDRQQGFLDTPHFNAWGERADDAPLSAHFTPQCANTLIRTLTVRMNAAEPDECYPGNFGSNLGLVLDSYEQAIGGMHAVLDGFRAGHDDVGVFTGHRVTALERRGDGRIAVHCAAPHDEVRDYAHAIVTLPAPHAADLLGDAHPAVAGELRAIRYFPVAVAIAKYRDAVFPPEQRAMVFDPDSPLSNAGSYGIHDRDLVRYTFSGRTARSVVTADTPAATALDIAEAALAPHFHIHGNVREDFVYRHMQTGLCAYSAHHGTRLARVRDAMPARGGITLTGDYWRGASIEACFRAAEEAVARMNTD